MKDFAELLGGYVVRVATVDGITYERTFKNGLPDWKIVNVGREVKDNEGNFDVPDFVRVPLEC